LFLGAHEELLETASRPHVKSQGELSLRVAMRRHGAKQELATRLLEVAGTLVALNETRQGCRHDARQSRAKAHWNVDTRGGRHLDDPGEEVGW